MIAFFFLLLWWIISKHKRIAGVKTLVDNHIIFGFGQRTNHWAGKRKQLAILSIFLTYSYNPFQRHYRVYYNLSILPSILMHSFISMQLQIDANKNHEQEEKQSQSPQIGIDAQRTNEIGG